MFKVLLHVFLFIITGGTYLIVYLPYLFFRSRQNRKPTSTALNSPVSYSRNGNYNPNNGYVYLIHAEHTNLYKIGRTSDVQRRFRELSATKGPHEYKLLKAVATKDCVETEKKMHHTFARFRRNGEWFELKKTDLKNAKKMMDKYS